VQYSLHFIQFGNLLDSFVSTHISLQQVLLYRVITNVMGALLHWAAFIHPSLYPPVDLGRPTRPWPPKCFPQCTSPLGH